MRALIGFLALLVSGMVRADVKLQEMPGEAPAPVFLAGILHLPDRAAPGARVERFLPLPQCSYPYLLMGVEVDQSNDGLKPYSTRTLLWTDYGRVYPFTLFCAPHTWDARLTASQFAALKTANYWSITLYGGSPGRSIEFTAIRHGAFVPDKTAQQDAQAPLPILPFIGVILLPFLFRRRYLRYARGLLPLLLLFLAPALAYAQTQIDFQNFSNSANAGAMPVVAPSWTVLASPAPTTTVFTVSGASAPVANMYIACNSGSANLLTASGANVKKISSVSVSGSNWQITLATALTAAPASGDIFNQAPNSAASGAGKPYYFFTPSNASMTVDNTGKLQAVGAGLDSLKMGVASTKCAWEYNNSDGASGNDSMATDVTFTGAVPTGFAVVLRETVNTSVPGTNGYLVKFNSNSFVIAKMVNGTGPTSLSSSVSTTISTGTSYYLEGDVTGSSSPTIVGYVAQLAGTTFTVTGGTASTFTATITGTTPAVGQLLRGSTGANTGSSTFYKITSLSGGPTYTISTTPALPNTPGVNDTLVGAIWMDTAGSFSSAGNTSKRAAITFSDTANNFTGAGRAGVWTNNTAASVPYVSNLNFSMLNPLTASGWLPCNITTSSITYNWNEATGGLNSGSPTSNLYTLKVSNTGTDTFSTAPVTVLSATHALTATYSGADWTGGNVIYAFLQVDDGGGSPQLYTWQLNGAAISNGQTGQALPMQLPTIDSTGRWSSEYYIPYIDCSPLTEDTLYQTASIVTENNLPANMGAFIPSGVLSGNAGAQLLNGTYGPNGFMNLSANQILTGSQPADINTTGTVLAADMALGTGAYGFTQAAGSGSTLEHSINSMFAPDQFTLDFHFHMLGAPIVNVPLVAYNDGTGNEEMAISFGASTNQITATFNTQTLSWTQAAVPLTLSTATMPLGNTGTASQDGTIILTVTGISGGSGTAQLFLVTGTGYIASSTATVPIPTPIGTNNGTNVGFRVLGTNAYNVVSVGRIRIVGHARTINSLNTVTPGTITIDNTTNATSTPVPSGAPLNPDIAGYFSFPAGSNAIPTEVASGAGSMTRMAALPPSVPMQTTNPSNPAYTQGTYNTGVWYNYLSFDRGTKYYSQASKHFNLSLCNIPDLFYKYGQGGGDGTTGTPYSALEEGIPSGSGANMQVGWLVTLGTQSSGTFTLTWNGQTTAAIARNATVAQVASALNALSGIAAVGTATVAGSTGGPYDVQIPFNVYTLTGDGSLLSTPANFSVQGWTDAQYALTLEDDLRREVQDGVPNDGTTIVDTINEPTVPQTRIDYEWNNWIPILRANYPTFNFKYGGPTPPNSLLSANAAQGSILDALCDTRFCPLEVVIWHDYGDPLNEWAKTRSMLNYWAGLPAGLTCTATANGAVGTLLTTTNLPVGTVLKCTGVGNANNGSIGIIRTSVLSAGTYTYTIDQFYQATTTGDSFTTQTLAGPSGTATGGTDASHFTVAVSVPVGQVLYFTSGAANGTYSIVRAITGNPGAYNVTVGPALGGTPANTDTFVTGYSTQFIAVVPFARNEGQFDPDLNGAIEPFGNFPSGDSAMFASWFFQNMMEAQKQGVIFEVLTASGASSQSNNPGMSTPWAIQGSALPLAWQQAFWQQVAAQTAGHKAINCTISATNINAVACTDGAHKLYVLYQAGEWKKSHALLATIVLPTGTGNSWANAQVTQTCLTNFLGSYFETATALPVPSILTGNHAPPQVDASGNCSIKVWPQECGVLIFDNSVNTSANTFQTYAATGWTPSLTPTALFHAVKLTWARCTATGFTEYRLYRGLSSSTMRTIWWGKGGNPSAGTQVYVDRGNMLEGLPAGVSTTNTPVTVYYALTAVDSFGNESVQYTTSVIPSNTPAGSGPGSLTNVTAYSGRSTTEITFTPPSDDDIAWYYCSFTSSTGNPRPGVWMAPTKTGVLNPTFSYPELITPGTTNTVQITPYNTSGIAGATATLNFNAATTAANGNNKAIAITSGATENDIAMAFAPPVATLTNSTTFTTSGGTLAWTMACANNAALASGLTFFTTGQYATLTRQQIYPTTGAVVVLNNNISLGSPVGSPTPTLQYQGTYVDSSTLTTGAKYVYVMTFYDNGNQGGNLGPSSFQVSFTVVIGGHMPLGRGRAGRSRMSGTARPGSKPIP